MALKVSLASGNMAHHLRNGSLRPNVSSDGRHGNSPRPGSSWSRSRSQSLSSLSLSRSVFASSSSGSALRAITTTNFSTSKWAFLIASLALALLGWSCEAGSEDFRRLSLAPEVLTSSVDTTDSYAYFYAAPAASDVPLVVGFTTGALTGYTDNGGKGKLKVLCASGLDFSVFEATDILDVMNLPEPSYFQASTSELEIYFESGSFNASTSYAATLMVRTGSSLSTLGTLTLSWYTWDSTSSSWIRREKTEQNSAANRPSPDLESHFVSGSVKSSSISLSGSTIVRSWSFSETVMTVLLDIYSSSTISGTLSIMPTPASAWTFGPGAADFSDGDACPDGYVDGEEGQALGVDLPSKISSCILRKRGGTINSFDLSVSDADFTTGGLVKLYLPLPLAGNFDPWYLALRQSGATPEYTLQTLPVSHTSFVKYFGATPAARIRSTSNSATGALSELTVDFQTGATLRNMANSRVDFFFDSSVFAVVPGGCDLTSAPFHGEIITSTSANACSLTWPTESTAGTGTVEVSADGQVTGTGTDFLTAGIVTLEDSSTVQGSAFHYFKAGDETYVAKALTYSSASGETIQVLAAASDNLVGAGTSFSTGGFRTRLLAGDEVTAGGRTFVVTAVTDDTTATVEESSAAPTIALSSSSFVVAWKTRLEVEGFFGNDTELATVASGSSFSLEVAATGIAFWNQTYSLKIIGRNSGRNATASMLPTLQVRSGMDEDDDQKVDAWTADFNGPQYEVFGLPAVSSVELHPTTVVTGAKARVALTFTTPYSSRFSGGGEETAGQGMVLRIYTEHSSSLELFKADGSSFDTDVDESVGIDCSTWLLEFWSEAWPYPNPSHCWWDAWSANEPSIYIRFPVQHGLRALTHYELVFLATMTTSTNGVAELINFEITDGDGTTQLGRGSGGLSKTIVTSSTEGESGQPLLTSIELVDLDPIPDSGELQFRLKTVADSNNAIVANNIVRLFLFPLTAWDIGSTCTVTRSDGGLIECSTSSTGRTTNVIEMDLDPNSPSLGSDNEVIFTVSGITLPKEGFFREPFAVEVVAHPEGTTYWASFLGSADGRLGGLNFAYSDVSAGNGSLVQYNESSTMAPNEVLLSFVPPATCRSTSDLPCRLTVKAPDGFTVLSAGVPAGSPAASSFTPFPLSALASPTCNQELRTCELDVEVGSALWAGVSYGILVVVENPSTPMEKGSVGNAWTLTQSGANLWRLGIRQEADETVLTSTESFAVEGSLSHVLAQPDIFTCGSSAKLRIHFVSVQLTPVGGYVNVTLPNIYSLQTDGSSGCYVHAAVNWPASVTCTAAGQVAQLLIGEALEKGTLHSFDLRVSTASSNVDEGERGHILIATSSGASALDRSEIVSWSAETDSSGALAHTEMPGCWPASLRSSSVAVDNALPYTATANATVARMQFELLEDVSATAVELLVHAPTGFVWDLSAVALSVASEAGGDDSVASPLSSNPSSGDPSSLLRLVTTGSLSKHTVYGFSAGIRVPEAAPGSAENPDSGPHWYFMLGWSDATRIAAATLVSTEPMVRVISDFTVARSTTSPSVVAAVSATFTTATAVPEGGKLVLWLPSSFDFGAHLDKNCAASASRAAAVAAAENDETWTLPPDATLECLASSTGRNSFVWTIGATGLSVGRYSLAVFARNAPIAAPGEALPQFTLGSYLDDAMEEVADAEASVRVSESLQLELPQVEMALHLVDSDADLIDLNVGHETWIVFAFELAEDISPDFQITVTAPVGFVFSSSCQVHIGDGSTYTVVGSSSASLGDHLSQYMLFPANTEASCAGHGNIATISVAPEIEVSRSNFPAVAGKMYLFRVQVTNPSSTPVMNDWSLKVSNQEYAGIPGFQLAEIRSISITTDNAAMGEEGSLTISFWTRTAIAGLFGARYGVLIVVMPTGFELVTEEDGTSCAGFAGSSTGFRNSSGYLGTKVSCEAISSWPTVVAIHNKLDTELIPGTYTFNVKVKNPDVATSALVWQLSTYSSMPSTTSSSQPDDLLDSVLLLDYGTARGPAIHQKLIAFGAQPSPAGQQTSGNAVTLTFAVELSHSLLTGDALLLHLPEEYQLSCSLSSFSSTLLPQPICGTNRAAFSFLEVEATQLPIVIPAGTEDATVVTFSLQAVNPSTKPTRNVVEFAHCRGITNNTESVLLETQPCPEDSTPLASVQESLWNVVPIIRDASVGLLSQKVAATNQSTNVWLSFGLVSESPTKIGVLCPGMDFTGCSATVQGTTVTCIGSSGVAYLTVSSLTLPAGLSAESIYVEMGSITNPTTAGMTTWTITSYGSDDDGDEIIFDQSEAFEGHRILSFLSINAVKTCTPQYLLSSGGVQSTWYKNCTAQNPFFGHEANKVLLNFNAFAGGEVMAGHGLVIQPPLGYSFPNTGAAAQLPTSIYTALGSQEYLDYEIVTMAEMPVEDAMTSLSDSAILINISSGETLSKAFSLILTVSNPVKSPSVNLWRTMLVDPDRVPLYTNDGNWGGFQLRGAFSSSGTSIKSLVTNFPSEANVIRLSIQLTSDLSGASLKMRVVAPSGFVFGSDCFPEHPNLEPATNLTVSAWVSACAHNTLSTNEAVLTIPDISTSGGLLSRGVTYATNLIVTNAGNFNSSNWPLWQIYTFKNNDNSNYVHYTTLQSYKLEVLWAKVTPEVPRLSTSSQLIVSVKPLRDLGPYGQVLLTAPSGYTLFCRLRPFFERGNLPGGASCSGANNFAIVQLSGSDSLSRGTSYQFTLRVTAPAASTTGFWSMTLQTQERVLIQETSQVDGHTLTETAISRFAVAATSSLTNTETYLRIQFKLDSVYGRASANRFVLTAPEGYTFSCAATQARNGYVLPSSAILEGSLDEFTDLTTVLEYAADSALDSYVNDGTTEDGRAIVDCSVEGVLSLVVDYTDLTTLGRYAFRVQVVNPDSDPSWNVWTLTTYTDSKLVEHGAASGYTLEDSTSTVTDESSSELPTIATVSRAQRIHLGYLAVLLAAGTSLLLCLHR